MKTKLEREHNDMVIKGIKKLVDDNDQKDGSCAQGIVYGLIVTGLVALLFIGGCLFSNIAQASDYTNEQIVNAIRKAEGNWNYGIKSVKCTTSAECRKICFNTVRNNRKRFAQYGFKNHPDFIAFLASRYCPIGAENDPTGLNKNWERNVRYFLAKGAK